MLKRILKWLLITVGVLCVIYLCGPRIKFDNYKLFDKPIVSKVENLDSLVATTESKVSNIKPNNQSMIVWADSTKKIKTEYCLLYLHGFSASQMEGDPVHRMIAKRYGMNLYLPRLADHGRADSTSFINLTPDNYIQSAEDALGIAKSLGNKVVVVSCSTGGTLSLILAAGGADIHSLIMYSPNIDIYDPLSEAVLYPWGESLSSIIMKGEYNRVTYEQEARKYWNPIYHMNGVFTVKYMTKNYMTSETFAKVKQPVFIGYYYKDEVNQDKVVSVKRMLECYDQLATEPSKKQKVAFPDAGHHVISSSIMSGMTDQVYNETIKWMEGSLGFKPIL